MTAERWAQVRTIVEKALALSDEERETYLAEVASQDPTILAEVQPLLAVEHRADSLFAVDRWMKSSVASLTSEAAGTVVGRYRLLREIGRGGMGAVFLAERADGVYQQQVAVKLLQEHMSNAAFIQRFAMERQILATLSHEGIARLVDGGVTDAGTPYAVMEFVDGRAIDVYCEAEALDLRARLRLFVAVARAVQYAHQQLVLHLDLKPANILITPEGEPRLLDFGIARLVSGVEPGDVAEATLRLLTPRYASPEQASGEPLGVASDVFSLSTLLYKLLTGRLPYPIETATPLEAVRILKETPPTVPSTLSTSGDETGTAAWRGELKGDLDAILLQGLRKEPERRYPTVAAMADDVERYLANQPVMAHRDSLSYRAGKFLQRHRSAVAAAAVVTVVLIGAAAAVIHSDVVAVRERKRADARFADVRALAHGYIFELGPQLEQIDGTVKVRAYVLKNALTYLNSLSQERSNDESLTKEMAKGYLAIGQVQSRIGQPSLSDRPGAWVSLKRGYELQRQVFDHNPSDMAQRGVLVAFLRVMADLAQQDGDLAASDKYALQGWELGQPIVAAGPKTPRYSTVCYLALDLAQNRGGESQMGTEGDPKGALEWLDRLQGLVAKYAALPVAEQPDPDLPATFAMQAGLVRASVLRELGRDAEARGVYEQILQASLSLLHDNPLRAIHEMVIRYTFAEYLLDVPDVAYAAKVAPPLVPASKPEAGADRSAAIQSAEVLTLYARIDLQSGAKASGRAKAQKAMAALEALEQAQPEDAAAKLEMAASFLELATTPSLDLPLRKHAAERAMVFLAPYLAANPTQTGPLLEQAHARIVLAEIAKQQHDASAQASMSDLAVHQLEQILAAHPGHVQAQKLLAEAIAAQK